MKKKKKKKKIKKYIHPRQIPASRFGLRRVHSARHSSRELLPKTFNLCRTKVNTV